jgi:UDP-3-O-[3-hydroxymyristoyl] glucosamine N-acyltransferase
LTASRSFRLGELAERVQGQLEGDAALEIDGIAALADAGPRELSFYAHEKYAPLLPQTRAGALLTHEKLGVAIAQVLVQDPVVSINELLDLFHPRAPAATAGIDRQARVDETATIGRDVSIQAFACVGPEASVGARTTIGAGAYLGRGVRVGEDSILGPNVVILDGSILGSRVILHAGAVVGADGFGYARRDGRFIRMRHVGTVVIEDDVEIGANATIDRATLGRTVIRRGVKLDNQVHIGHNVEVGEDTVMAAQCGVSGSTVVGRRVMMGGQVGLVDHLVVGDEAKLVAQSGVIGDVAPGAIVSGYPARAHREVLRAQAELRTLARLRARVSALERKLSGLADEV